MIVLYSGSGSGDFELIGTAYDDASFRNLKQNAIAVLNARGERRGAELISAYPFTISNAFNHFNDEFCVLHATVCLERYEAARNMAAARSDRTAFAKVAEVMNEIGPYIRFIAVELDMSKPSRPASTGLTEMQIKKLVSRYIGVEGGYLALPSQQRWVNLGLRASIMHEQAGSSYMKEVLASNGPVRMP